MLAHLEDLDFSALLEHLNMGHVFFLDLLDGDLQTCAFVSAQLDQSELALAQSFFKFVVVKDVGVAHSLLKSLNPQSLFLLSVKINNSRFVGRDRNFDWVKLVVGAAVN